MLSKSMKKTKINGYPGFGLPSEMGKVGDIGNSVYFVDKILYEPLQEDENIWNPSGDIITYEYYYGKDLSDRRIVKFHVSNKPIGYNFKTGDVVAVNIDRCCFFDVFMSEDGKSSFIKNEPKYKITLSPIKLMNFSFSAQLSEATDTQSRRVIIYPSLIVEKQDLIKNFHIELIHGSKQKNYMITTEMMESESVSLDIPNDFQQNSTTQATINIYAVCRTHSMGYREYFVGTEKVGI